MFSYDKKKNLKQKCEFKINIRNAQQHGAAELCARFCGIARGIAIHRWDEKGMNRGEELLSSPFLLIIAH